jgi:hypothetical protein
MKPNSLILFTALVLSVIFNACEKPDLLPEKNHSGGDTGTGTGGDNGGGTTPPPAGGGGPIYNPSPEADAVLAKFEILEFTYDAQKRLLTYDDVNLRNDKYTIVYEGDKAVRLEYETGHHLIYLYEDDKVTGAIVYWEDREIKHYQFEYSGNKMVKKISNNWSPNYNRGWLIVEEYRYDERGNLIELASAAAQSDKLEDLGPRSYISWGNYDRNPNPMPYAQSDLYLPGVKLFENNPGYRQTGYREIFTYTYHESGLPKERYTKLDTHLHLAPFIARYQYQ